MLRSEFLNTIPVRNSVFGVKVWVFCWRAQFQDRKNQRREEVGLHDSDDSSLELYKHDADDDPFNFLFIYPTPFFVLLPSKMMGSTLQNPLASTNTSPFERGRNERRPPSPLAMADRRSAFAWAQNTKAKKAEKARWGEKHIIKCWFIRNWEEKHDLGELGSCTVDII